jgi:hypothetical protein
LNTAVLRDNSPFTPTMCFVAARHSDPRIRLGPPLTARCYAIQCLLRIAKRIAKHRRLRCSA